MKLALVCLGVACGDALKLNCRPPTTAGGRHAAVHRRAFLGSAATAASLLVCPPAFAGGKKKDYLTMGEYQKLKDEDGKTAVALAKEAGKAWTKLLSGKK